MEIRPVNCAPGQETGIEKSTTYYLHRLDLRKSPQELFHSFHKDCVQRKIRRAERESLSTKKGNSEALLKKFYRLLVMTRRRQHLPPQPIYWFRALMASFGPDLRSGWLPEEGRQLPVFSRYSIRRSLPINMVAAMSNLTILGGQPAVLANYSGSEREGVRRARYGSIRHG